MGTPTNTAIVKYMNAKKVPHILLATGASKWGNPKDNPWTMGWYPTYFTEGVIYGKYILKNIKDAKIGILYQNDDYGKDFVNGLKQGLGDQAGKLIVKEVSYEVTDPDRRFADRDAEGIRRERLLQRDHQQGRRPGHPQGLRHRLASDPVPGQQRLFDRDRADPGGSRQVGRYHLDRLLEGSGRSRSSPMTKVSSGIASS